MKRKIKTLTLAILSLIFIAASCDKEKNYPKDSILGTWRSFEQSSIHGYRQYNVSIDYYGSDSTQIIIYNFYNLGYQLETYASIQDTIITLLGTNTFDDFSGTGHIKRDFSAIFWEFSYFGNAGSDLNIEAFFRRP